LKISAIIPAYNEAENITLVVDGLLALRSAVGEPLIHEVIVADNGSSDETAAVAGASGATVIHVPERGYGSACARACEIATGDVLLFADGDHTADLAQAPLLIAAIARGADLAIGVRADAAHGSLTFPQRFGNALACLLVRLIWAVPITDLGPFRAIRGSAYRRIGMRDRAYGWTIEMQIRAAQLQLHTIEVAVSWLPRHAGHSKVSGTVKGVLGAAWGIFSMIAKLWLRERDLARLQRQRTSDSIIPVAVLPAGQAQPNGTTTTTRRPFLSQE
jgi:glycosyltransferase involved in cell wall biosynthesis